jgi:predicted alpha/beta hydrolase
MAWRDVSFTASDGVTLAGSLFEVSTPEAITILHGATGVPVSYYQPFAEWYATHTNRAVLIYAYRDSDNPTVEQLRASKTTMADWGIRDQSAALDFMIDRFPSLPVHIIGHSLGGFCTPYHANADKITSLTGVNSGLAYWKATPASFMFQVILFWYLAGPALTKILGYMPGQLLGMKNGIPASVYWQWRAWCTHPCFYEPQWGKEVPKPDLTKFTGKLRLIASADDTIIPPLRVKELQRYYPCASSPSFEVLNPADFNVKSIGHIQIFSKRCKSVWPVLVS